MLESRKDNYYGFEVTRESKAAKYVFPIPVSAPLENRNIDTYRLGGIAMLESRKDNYYGFEVTMYRIGDHLWISNIMPNAQYLVNQFNYDKMIWTQTFLISCQTLNT